MAEAAEIAKLRLFLKLAAQLDDPARMEPLPDLDFNIKSGNLLVGIADATDIERRFSDRGVLPFGLELAMDAAESVAAAYDDFVAAQAAETGAEGEQHAKGLLQAKIKAISGQVDAALYEMRNESQDFEEWRKSHQPFHWFAEFPAVWRNGGFDAIIGNPPYIGLKGKKRNQFDYKWVGYETENCPDLYAVCTERASTLLNDKGRFAMIVMHSLCFHKGYKLLREYLENCFSMLWVSSYWSNRNGLFAGSANVRNTVVIASGEGNGELNTSRCRRWSTSAREHLFATQQYVTPNALLLKCGNVPQWPFVDEKALVDAFASMAEDQARLGQAVVQGGVFALGYKKVARYMLGAFVDPPPIVSPTGVETISPHDAWLSFESSVQRDLALMVLTGRWAYVWWAIYGDEFHVTRGVLVALPCDIERLAASHHAPCDMELEILVDQLLSLASNLKKQMPHHLQWHITEGGGRVGRYELSFLRHITDEADWLLAQAWGLTWEQYEAAGNLRDRMTFGNRE